MGEMIEEAVTNPSLVGVKLKQDLLDIAFPATVQSGGVYDLRATAQNDERPLKYDVITVSIGVLLLLALCASAAIVIQVFDWCTLLIGSARTHLCQ